MQLPTLDAEPATLAGALWLEVGGPGAWHRFAHAVLKANLLFWYKRHLERRGDAEPLKPLGCACIEGLRVQLRSSRLRPTGNSPASGRCRSCRWSTRQRKSSTMRPVRRERGRGARVASGAAKVAPRGGRREGDARRAAAAAGRAREGARARPPRRRELRRRWRASLGGSDLRGAARGSVSRGWRRSSRRARARLRASVTTPRRSPRAAEAARRACAALQARLRALFAAGCAPAAKVGDSARCGGVGSAAATRAPPAAAPDFRGRSPKARLPRRWRRQWRQRRRQALIVEDRPLRGRLRRCLHEQGEDGGPQIRAACDHALAQAQLAAQLSVPGRGHPNVAEIVEIGSELGVADGAVEVFGCRCTHRCAT